VLHPVPKVLEAGTGICGVIVSASKHIEINEEHLKVTGSSS
jgi:hypothetical protein